MSDTIKCLCNKCKLETNHNVLFEKTQKWDSNGGDIYGEDTYYIVQCCGCDEISFLRKSWNSEDFDVNNDGELEPIFFLEQLPKISIGYGNIEDKYYLPKNILEVYEETVDCINNDNLVLACIGLRTILDILCKNEKIKEKTLIKQIEALKNKKIISQSDSELLQGIRTLGNDAAHEGIDSSKDTIILAINIIEHIIETKYIYKNKAKYMLSTATYKYKDYVQIIMWDINRIKIGTEFKLEEILEKENRRLVTNSLKKYEGRIIKDINNNLIINLVKVNKGNDIFYKRNGHAYHKKYDEENNYRFLAI